MTYLAALNRRHLRQFVKIQQNSRCTMTKKIFIEVNKGGSEEQNMNFDCTPELSLQVNGLINDDNITWNSRLDGCKHVLPSVQAELFFFFF